VCVYTPVYFFERGVWGREGLFGQNEEFCVLGDLFCLFLCIFIEVLAFSFLPSLTSLSLSSEGIGSCDRCVCVRMCECVCL